MGKDSLIKSTSKKKTKSANEEETKKKSVKKAAAKPKKAAKPKTAKKSPAKTTKAVAAKTTAKKTKSAAAKPKAKTAAAKPKAKTAAAKPSAKKSAAPAKSKAKPKAAAKKTKKATIPELLAKKFDSLPGTPKPKPAAPEKRIFEASPPVISTSDSAEAARIRTLLMTKFSMAEVKAAAKPPEPEKPEAAATEAPAPEPEAPEGETPAAKGVETPAAPADEPPVITTTVVQEDAPEPISRAIKYGIAAMALIVLFLLGISYNNSSKYYIHPKEGALEIWKGRFSPKDRQFFMVLHGVQLDQEVKAIYSRSDVYPMIFDYYLEKADTLLEVPGLPDFEGIKGYLYEARSYAITPATKDKVKGRLNSIERMILLYKADVAVSKNTEDSLKAALKDLQKASGLVANPTQKQEIDQKIELIKKLQNELKSMPK
jgi:hypothetical protein